MSLVKNKQNVSKGKTGGLLLTQANLGGLDDIKLDDNLNQLLTKLGGKITIEINGKTANTVVGIKSDGKTTRVTVKELLAVLAAPGKIRAIAKEQKNLQEEGSMKELISRIAHAFGTTVDQITSLTPERFGMIKQSIRLLEKLESNADRVAVIVAKHPEDKFGKILTDSINLCRQIVAKGISCIITEEKTVSESNRDELEATKLPTWVFKKLTAQQPVDQNTSPYLFFFPRKKWKGVTVTTTEIRDGDFRVRNAILLEDSTILANLLNSNDFLNEVMSLNDYLVDDVATDMFNKHAWHVFPPIEVGAEHFFKMKNKGVVESIPDPSTIDFKKKLIKIDNALMRSALLESSGFRPDLMICNQLFPNSDTNYDPSTGINIFDAMAAEEHLDLILGYYIGGVNPDMIEIRTNIFCSEIKISNSDRIRRMVSDATEVYLNPEDRDPVLPAEDDRMGNPFTDLMIPDFNLIDTKQVIRDGDPVQEQITTLNVTIFELLARERAISKKVEKNQPIPRSKMSKKGDKFVKFIKNLIGAKASKSVENYLRSFSCNELQEEALNRIAATCNSDLTQFIKKAENEDEMEENPFDNSGNSESSESDDSEHEWH
jgi:hypothetical protein